MKTLKVYNDIHREVKVEAARSGRSSTNLASELLRWALQQAKKGKVALEKLPSEEATR
jgi:plasmid stability protein